MSNNANKTTRTPVIILAAVLALIIFAATITASAVSKRKAVDTDNIGAKAAVNAALSDAGIATGDVTLTKSEYDGNDKVYEVEFTVGKLKYNYRIDAKTSAVVNMETDIRPQKDNITGETTTVTTGPETNDLYIGLEAAKAAAVSDAGLTIADVTFTKAKLDNDDFVTGYEIEFYTETAEYDYDINANTGAITDKSIETRRSAETASTTSVPDNKVSLDDAKAIALSDAGLTADEVTFTKAKLDTDDSVTGYEIEFYTATAEYDYDINADTGVITDKSKETRHTAGTAPVPPVSEKNISLEEAKAAALRDAGLTESDVTFTKAKLDTDDFNSEYEIEFYTDTAEYDYDVDAKSGAITDKSKEARQSADTAPVHGNEISPEEAKAIVLKDAGLAASKVTFSKTEFDIDDGMAKYEIEFYHGTVEYEYEINAGNGAVIQKSTENHAPTSQTGVDYIGIDKAKTAALSHAGLSASDVRFTKAKLEDDDGKTVYEIEFRYGVFEYEYEIDALTGSIIEFDKETDD